MQKLVGIRLNLRDNGAASPMVAHRRRCITFAKTRLASMISSALQGYTFPFRLTSEGGLR